jgi:cellulose biosynthesis protein BcsQ
MQVHRTVLQRLPLSIHQTELAHLDIVPSHILLSDTDVELTTALDHREERLQRELDIVAHCGTYDPTIQEPLGKIALLILVYIYKASP